MDEGIDATLIYTNSPYSAFIARYIQNHQEELGFIAHKIDTQVTAQEDALVPQSASIPYLKVVIDGEVEYYWKKSYPYTIETILQMFVEDFSTKKKKPPVMPMASSTATSVNSGIGRRIVSEADKSAHGADAVSPTFLRMIGNMQRKPQAEDVCPCPPKGNRDIDGTYRYIKTLSKERDSWGGPSDDLRRKILESARAFSHKNGSNMLGGKRA